MTTECVICVMLYDVKLRFQINIFTGFNVKASEA